MKTKIRVLSDHTINQIAAGEVIENPSSVVKELVENALDAGATDICVEIQGGGRNLIRISDNGCGMSADDALLCLERHATSKLKDVEDIHSISTMGFRGEAIPSIASISKFNILTCPANNDESSQTNGTMVIVDGGKLISSSPAARSPGTTVEVKSLFFNVPVRKKFLRSPSADANEIYKTVSLMALGYPTIKFHLISDGKTLLSTLCDKGSDKKKLLLDRVESILGCDFLQNTVYVSRSSNGAALEGVIGIPSYTRHNRSGQYLFINRRAVISPFIAFAVKDGYGTSIDSGRFPVFVLNLTVDGGWVDVNVHPQKREVRLRQEQIIRDLIVNTIRDGLSHRHHQNNPIQPHVPISPVFAQAFSRNEPTPSLSQTSAWEFKPKAAPAAAIRPTESQDISSDIPFARPPHHTPQPANTIPPSLPLPQNPAAASKMIGAIPGYILLDGRAALPFETDGKEGLVLVDQRNAHARIIFEKISNHTEGESLAQQTLLIPHTIEMPAHEAARLRTSLPLLHKIGLRIEEFGSNTFLIDALPQVFGKSNIDLLLSEVIHNAELSESNPSHFQEQAKKIAAAASRSAVSSNRCLTQEEGQSLLAQLARCRQPHFCPYGKPVFVHLNSEGLAKLFHK